MTEKYFFHLERTSKDIYGDYFLPNNKFTTGFIGSNTQGSIERILKILEHYGNIRLEISSNEDQKRMIGFTTINQIDLPTDY